LSDDEIEGARNSPYWPPLEEVAHTLADDAALYGPPPIERLASIAQPTLVITGGAGSYFAPAANAIAASVPNAELLILEGQGHVADPNFVAPVLRRFFGA
jgi:pimeloyl-ACP methyl ester carboxylesterase